VITILLVPVLLVFSILIAGLNKLPPAEASGGKGLVQVAFTGIVTTMPNQNFQSVSLNVMGVRFNESSDTTISDADPGWQTVAVSPGASAGSIFPSLSFGGNFGPNGNAVGVGSARTEMQIDVAQLQNNLAVFNIGKINAITYKQVELLLDPTNPGTVTPVCGSGTSTGEGCIPYPVQLAGGSSPRFPFDGGLLTVGRNATKIFPLAISVQVGASPATSSDQVVLTTNICPVITGTTTPPCTTFTAPNVAAVAAVVTGSIKGANNSAVVNAQLPGTGTIVSSATVDSTAAHNFTMVLPAGTYDFVAGSGPNHTIDAWSSVPVPQASPMVFTVKNTSTRPLSGTVADACTGKEISGATIQVYGPPTHIGVGGIAEDCSTAGTCPSDCDKFLSGLPPAGCVIIASSSTSDRGVYPFSPSGAGRNAFSTLPLKTLIGGVLPTTTTNYGLMGTASGFNGELLNLKDRSGILKCDGSGYKDNACSFSLQHGTLQVTADAGAPVSSTINVMLNAEDQGTFNGEGVQMFTIPAGQQVAANVPILVPIQGTPFTAQTPAAGAAADETGASLARAPTTTPTSTGTPVVIGGAATYDLFASVQDVFNKGPQKFSGHTIAVVSGAAAPATSCATVVVSDHLTPLTCVGHGSVSGAIAKTDQNTLLAISKAVTGGTPVFISSSLLPQTVGSISQNFAVCEPVDTYTISHYEAQPTGTPVLISASDPVPLASPTTIPNTAKNPCFGICSTGDTSTCLLCQPSTPLPPIP